MEEARRPAGVAEVSMDCDFMACPVTALAFLEAAGLCLLAGEDGWLRVYDAATGRLCGELRVFAASVIHGLCVGERDVLLWAGHSVAVLPRSLLDAIAETGVHEPAVHVEEAAAPDWVYDGVLAPVKPFRDGLDGVLVTAHNEIVELRITRTGDARHPSVAFGRVISPSRPILYSANVRWLNHDAVLVAGGTVFGEIIIWKWLPETEASEVLFVLEGHEGSIFGVHMSDELTMPSGNKMRLLASCSDDRTVRVWDITERECAAHETAAGIQNGRLVDEARETGFGGKGGTEDGPQTGSVEIVGAAAQARSKRALAVVMAHASRIWHVKISPQGLLEEKEEGQGSSPMINIYSFGEDATQQEWLLRFDKDAAATLTHTRTMPCHSGKHIWSTALWLGGGSDRRPLIATGGADGKIGLLGDLDTRLPESKAANSEAAAVAQRLGSTASHDSSSYLFEDLLSIRDGATPEQVSSGGKAKGVETFKNFAFLSPDELLVASTFGSLFIAHIKTDHADAAAWVEVPMTEAERFDLKNYNIVRGGDSGHHACFLGSATGSLYVLTSRPRPRLLKVAAFGKKIIDIFPVSRRYGSLTDAGSIRWPDAAVHVVITLFGHDAAYLLSLAGEDVDGDGPIGIQQLKVPLEQRCVVTAAAFFDDALVLGTRDGQLVFYGHERIRGAAADDAGLRKELRSETNSRDAITCIVPLPGVRPGTESPYILTTCRDGKYMIHELVKAPETQAESEAVDRHVKLIHESSPPFGPVITEAWLQEVSEGEYELMLCGFRSRYFVVWNETRQHEVATVDCGGVHRTFAYSHRSDAPQGWIRFAYIKAQRAHIYTQRSAGHAALRSGMHGREVRAAAWCGDLLATASEDTTVRIWRYAPQSAPGPRPTEMRCLACVNVHTAGLQALQWCGPDYLISSGGNEELFVWRVSRLDLKSAYAGGLAMVREAVYPDRTPDRDLRILSIAVDAADPGFVLSLALSNSVLKSYRYSRDGGFALLALGRYTGVCLTQIRHLDVRPGGRLCLLTAATDGCVVVWECAAAAAEYTARAVYRLHQSSIKGLDVWPTCSGECCGAWVVLTAGDDNALGILQLREEPAPAADAAAPAVTSTGRAVVRSAHAAGITGIRVAGPSGAGAILATTISNDQRLKVWRLRLGHGAGVEVQLLQDCYSAVADAGDLDLLQGPSGTGGKLVVAGVGVEVWTLRVGSIVPRACC